MELLTHMKIMKNKVKMQTIVPVELFISFFKPYIRVLFDWERLQKENWPINISVIHNIDIISSWSLPWSINKQGKEVRYDSPEARPIQLTEVPHIFSSLKKERQQSIINFSKLYIDSPHPVQFVVPAFALPDGKGFFMDGNHRMSALILAKIPFCLLIFTVHGPTDNSIIPELRHWEKNPKIHLWE